MSLEANWSLHHFGFHICTAIDIGIDTCVDIEMEKEVEIQIEIEIEKEMQTEIQITDVDINMRIYLYIYICIHTCNANKDRRTIPHEKATEQRWLSRKPQHVMSNKHGTYVEQLHFQDPSVHSRRPKTEASDLQCLRGPCQHQPEVTSERPPHDLVHTPRRAMFCLASVSSISISHSPIKTENGATRQKTFYSATVLQHILVPEKSTTSSHVYASPR